MRRIMVLNPKGGCGKSTIATNLASYYANQGQVVAMADFDSQGSTVDWLAVRPPAMPSIEGIAVENETDKPDFMLPLSGGVLIMDVPAAIHGKVLKRYVKLAHTIIIPVLPSPMDIRATARFIRDLLLIGRVSREKVMIAVVANRVREHTRIYGTLRKFLRSLDIPFIATLRDSQNYIRAASRGIGIFEMPPSRVSVDLEQWQPLIDWLESEKSLP